MIYLLCVIFIFTFFATSHASAHSTNSIIQMTTNGFEPVEITVDENTPVEFVNNDSVDRWPASNTHPTHDLYPQFDPKKPIKPGESWRFNPAKIGKWRYHDHLFPHKRGVITVEGEQTTSVRTNLLDMVKQKIAAFVLRVKSLFAQDEFLTMNQKEQFKTLENIAKTRGGEGLWQYIITTFKGQEGQAGNVHDVAHFAGSLLFDTNGFAGLGVCTPEFGFGCYHGFLDKAFSKSLDISEAEQGCSSAGSVGSGPYASCIHGIGHGISSFYQVTDLKNSLAACETLTNGKEYCYDGVFMEFARDAPPTFYKKSDLVYPCNAIEGKHIFACGRNQPTVMMERFNLSFEDTSATCLKSSNKDFRSACFDALGFVAVSRASGAAQAIINDCNKIKNTLYHARCVQSAAGELVFQNYTNWQETSRLVCDSLQNESKQSCSEYVQKTINSLR